MKTSKGKYTKEIIEKACRTMQIDTLRINYSR